ncbi:hypothetical protein A3I25_01110 [Candidatus Nomurabacteria bacterium RIFCSPLOWO2_02_FULL_42_17]|uniref:Glycerate kinase n=2 Tax=Candidatus Nomuraibacteriota TaxID=1752729 RepID=A0A1F6WJS3_9BACT|nr:MAG: hypothetical protein A3B93_02400 [Candidatus Nomurabacteria bacterium RIFCSPHIGHO2_02_FULL_42_24]OGI96913.1 MAG: hypothetical protein A3I25_01110 [Candidatus Nomurabacteria bacterium RIFCSPLOWO2_02_FULL_42_17]
MKERWIKNFKELATTKNRETALLIAEAGLDAINTEKVILDSIKLENNILLVQGQSFDLSKFKRIKVVGFGKASCDAAMALEKILEDKIKEGVVIGLQKITCDYIQTFVGTHPRPSEVNIEAGKKIFEIADQLNEDDLVIAIISGGGSALLCYPESECTQGRQLYDVFLKCGQTITEINTIRKHLSFLKGGGLAKIAYPATVIGLIFSDVPGDRFEDVASGPTYKDKTTVHDAEMIIHEHNLGKFDLVETPKEDKYFEKVHNFVLVSNKTAVEAMVKKSKELGLEAKIISTELYENIDVVLKKIFSAQKEPTGFVILAAGEPKLEVTKKGGSGGRNLFMALRAVKDKIVDENSVFIPLASDGMDNSDSAGAIIDKQTYENVEKTGINIDTSLKNFDVYPIFQKSGNMILTGATGANVSDLMILLIRK